MCVCVYVCTAYIYIITNQHGTVCVCLEWRQGGDEEVGDGQSEK